MFIEPNRGAVLKEHAELSPDLIELSLRQGGDVLAVDPDLAPVGLQEADEVLEKHRLAGARRTKQDCDLAFRDVEGDALEDGLGAERFREPPCLFRRPAQLTFIPQVSGFVAVPSIRPRGRVATGRSHAGYLRRRALPSGLNGGEFRHKRHGSFKTVLEISHL
jgi:hypothetical protein